MIAIDQMPPVGQRMDRAMPERVRGEALARRAQCGVVGDPPERDDHAHVRERRKLPFEKRTAIRDFRRNRLVLWRQTFDAVDDDRAVERQSVVDPRIISPPAQPELVKRRSEEHTSELQSLMRSSYA